MSTILSLEAGKSSVRAPAVAGLFYPEDPLELRRTVRQFLDEQPIASPGRLPKALIVPHAGYLYSGTVAGCGYRLLAAPGGVVRHVVLMGPSHRVPMRGLAVPSHDYFATPLGDVPIDKAGRQRLRELGLAGIADAPHAGEHALEVQVPFLQSVLRDFDLLPIAIGFAPPAQVARALEAIWDGPETLIVVSSDLSHYHTSAEARILDDQASSSIVGLRSDLADEQACGARAINGLMEVARLKGLRVKLLDLRNSGDTAGDRSRVVGYGSYALYDA